MAALRREIVRTGTWLYDRQVEKTVRIIRQNFDPYYWPEDGDIPEDRHVNDEGMTYTVAFGELTESWWFDSERAPVTSEKEAMHEAERLVGEVDWAPKGPALPIMKGAV